MSENLSAKYYQEIKERLYKKLVKDIKIILIKKKKKKRQYGRERYKNLSENEKNKLVEYRKNITKREKMLYCNYKKVF